MFRKWLLGRREPKMHQNMGRREIEERLERLRKSIDQIVDQARILKKKGNAPDSMDVDEEAFKELHETPGGLRV